MLIIDILCGTTMSSLARQKVHTKCCVIVDDGFSSVEYVDPKVEVIDENSAILSSGWKMNKAKGVITKELWVLQEDGSAKLRIDEFEALGE